MASQPEICNRALIKLGPKTITTLTDNTTPARVLSGLWDTVRKAELSKRYWNFALQRTSLAALGTTPSWGFANQYQLPNDYLKLVMVNDTYVAPGLTDYRTQDDSPYAIEGSALLTNFGAPLKLRYVRDITDPAAFHPLFVEVMAAKLAYEACYAITQSNTGRQQAAQDYKDAVKEAAQANALDKPPQGLVDDSWVLGRL